MIEMLQSLFGHMEWADTALLKAVGGHEGAFADDELRKWLHHIVVVERFFVCLLQHRPFDAARERQVPGTMAGIERLFEEAHADLTAYGARLDEAELMRTIEFPIPSAKDFHPAVRDALTQVAMHGEHHRAQVAMRLRALGGAPPVTDYIIWVRDVKEHAGGDAVTSN